jgi:hypothetical protein
LYGHIFGAQGISPDPKKVAAIKNASVPKDVGEVRSFLAMTNYVGRFIPNYSTITEPFNQNSVLVWVKICHYTMCCKFTFQFFERSLLLC